MPEDVVTPLPLGKETQGEPFEWPEGSGDWWGEVDSGSVSSVSLPGHFFEYPDGERFVFDQTSVGTRYLVGLYSGLLLHAKAKLYRPCDPPSPSLGEEERLTELGRRCKAWLDASEDESSADVPMLEYHREAWATERAEPQEWTLFGWPAFTDPQHKANDPRNFIAIGAVPGDFPEPGEDLEITVRRKGA